MQIHAPSSSRTPDRTSSPTIRDVGRSESSRDRSEERFVPVGRMTTRGGRLWVDPELNLGGAHVRPGWWFRSSARALPGLCELQKHFDLGPAADNTCLRR